MQHTVKTWSKFCLLGGGVGHAIQNHFQVDFKPCYSIVIYKNVCKIKPTSMFNVCQSLIENSVDWKW